MKRGFVPILAGLLLIAGGCTKDLPFKTEAKDQTLTDKAVIDPNAKYLYVASYENASRSSSVARPYWMGSEHLVRFQFTENSLQLLEVDPQTKFADNPTNSKLVLEIPVQNIAYRCQKDRFGECTNTEEQNKDLPWNQRNMFVPDFTKVKMTEVSVLPVEMENFFGGPCYTEVGNRLLDYVFDSDSLNIRIERTFQVDAKCADETVDSLSDLTFSSIYHYSIVKLSKLTTPTYQSVIYPDADQSTFGFFTTDVISLDPDNRDVVTGKTTYLSRWSPDRKELVYFLNEPFSKPENSAIREATVRSVSNINDALKASGTDLHIRLEDANGKQAGDLRNNMIVAVEDPVAGGVIGYGPTASNPETGEITSGRVVMYLGTIKKYIRRTYDEFIQKQLAEKASAGAKTPAPMASMLKPAPKESALISSLLKSTSDRKTVSLQSITPIRASKGPISLPLNLSKVKQEVMNYHAHVAPTSRLKDRIEALSAHCQYPADLVNFEDAVEQGLNQLVGKDLKPWDELDDGLKKQIVDLIVPFVWVPTLVHELGHNLGLRHNFAGSEDKDNYYSDSELKAMGIGHPITYSSVMDYSYRNLNELPNMGKYDIAALKFGYQRQVALKDGSVVPVPTTYADLQKTQGFAAHAYKYCTDEHVDANPGCKRFDEGSSFTDIASHFVASYEQRSTDF